MEARFGSEMCIQFSLPNICKQDRYRTLITPNSWRIKVKYSGEVLYYSKKVDIFWINKSFVFFFQGPNIPTEFKQYQPIKLWGKWITIVNNR